MRLRTHWAVVGFMACQVISAHAANPAAGVSQCLQGLRTEFDRIDQTLRGIGSEDDEPPMGSAWKLVNPGACSTLLAKISRDPGVGTVPKFQAEKIERQACLELQRARLENFCKCNAVSDAPPDDSEIAASLAARQRFRQLKTRIQTVGIRDPLIQEFVKDASEIEQCWSTKATVLLTRMSDAIQAHAFDDSSSVSPIMGDAPSVSPIAGGSPTVSPINGGASPVASVRAAPSPATVPSPPRSSISGVDTHSQPSSAPSTDYRTSGAATNAAKDVLDFAAAYSKSMSDLRSIAPPPRPTPHVMPSRPLPAMIYHPSGISGLHH